MMTKVVKIGSSHVNLTSKERIFRLIKDQGQAGIISREIQKTTGIKQGTVGSVLKTLQEEKKIFAKTVPGKRIKRYYIGQEGDYSPNIQQIRRMLNNLNNAATELKNRVGESIQGLNYLEDNILRMAKSQEEVTKSLKKALDEKEEAYNKIEIEHFELLKKIEDLTK